MKYIELFAGCGGLSLGLTAAGHTLLFANELSAMAAETYAFNLLSVDLTQEGSDWAQKVKWISSNFPSSELSRRLRENPSTFPTIAKGFSELTPDLSALENNLLIGDITSLNEFITSNQLLSRDLQLANVDLVSGGPPCQSFSMAGLRQHDNQRNQLPMEFAKFVGLVKPKVSLLENVSGILKAFKVGHSKYYAWFEVARAFAAHNYYPLCLHLNAKYAGAAQNRPRFIMLAFREDVFNALIETSSGSVLFETLEFINRFVEREKSGETNLPNSDLSIIDIEKNKSFFKQPLFSPLLQFTEGSFFTAMDAIDDLKEGNRRKQNLPYLRLINKKLGSEADKRNASGAICNHEYRSNSLRVRQRFLLYQYLSDLKTRSGKSSKSSSAIEKNVLQFLKEPNSVSLSNETLEFLKSKSWLMADNKRLAKINDSPQLIEYLKRLATKKQTQRALRADRPAPAALSIPDDACHYDINLQRTLTVREMARFQSFPDWFEFRSKLTTGGSMRRYEVPQYTQVGNAVPPLLGRALGEVVSSIIDQVEGS